MSEKKVQLTKQKKTVSKKKPATSKVAKEKPAAIPEVVAEAPVEETPVVEETSLPNEEVLEMEEVNPVEVAEEAPNPEAVAVINQDKLSAYDHKKIDKDIKYRGPLSYRYFRLIGWMCMSIMFISMILGVVMNLRSLFSQVTPEQMAAFSFASEIMSFFSAMPLPLFLIANFAVILQQKNNYKKLIKSFGTILLAIYIGFIVVYYHYVIWFLARIEEVSFWEARESSIEIFATLGQQNGLVVNVFVDLFMCVLIMFFIDYTPKKYFQGKKIILFRLLALLPILYEFASAFLMGLMGMNARVEGFVFWLPPELLPLIGKKPIGMIVAFVIICLFLKFREKRYIKKGGTHEGYELYLKTNRNSFKVSLTMSIIFLVVALVDFFAFLIPLVVAYASGGEDEAIVTGLMDMLSNFTLGKSVCLLLVIPFTLLFSYTKTHKNQKIDKFVPFIGIGLIFFAIIETLFFSILF